MRGWDFGLRFWVLGAVFPCFGDWGFYAGYYSGRCKGYYKGSVYLGIIPPIFIPPLEHVACKETLHPKPKL